MSDIKPSLVEIRKKEGKRENVGEKCEGKNGGAPRCADYSLDCGEVLSGQWPRRHQRYKGKCYHPETFSWFIPLRQRFPFIVNANCGATDWRSPLGT